jgi:uncharacterized membrane protein YfbV (UPF0208 family)
MILANSHCSIVNFNSALFYCRLGLQGVWWGFNRVIFSAGSLNLDSWFPMLNAKLQDCQNWQL